MELQWGRRYVMVEPSHFRVEYAINPFMHLDDQPDLDLAQQQWRDLVATIESLGGTVDAIAQREDAPDMVYAMNLGMAFTSAAGERRVLMSHMRFPERRMETGSAAQWFAADGRALAYAGKDGVGPVLEAGDFFAFGDALVVGYGPRTDELALKSLAAEMGVRVRGVRTTHPGMYHLDLAFCPLDDRRAIVCPAALDEASAEALLALVPEPLVITEEEALETFCANSIVIGSTVVMPACPAHVRAQLEEWGFAVVLVDVSEFHKGGGSIRCLTNPVDVVVGRDLPSVVGGEVLVP